MNHFPVECTFSKNYYFKVREWLWKANIDLPILTLEKVITGISDDSFKSYLLILWKFSLYKARERKKIPVLAEFESLIKEYEKIEYAVAKRKSKLFAHLQKYEKLREILR